MRVNVGHGKVFTGRGSDGDIVVASTKAYLNALNRLLAAESRRVRGLRRIGTPRAVSRETDGPPNPVRNKRSLPSWVATAVSIRTRGAARSHR